jgi:hypothetical protein
VVKVGSSSTPASGDTTYRTAGIKSEGASLARLIPQVIEDSDDEEDSFAARIRKRREEQERRRQRQKTKNEETTKDRSILDSIPII